MPDATRWSESKAEYHKGRWRASRDPKQVSLASRITADLQISAYQDALTSVAHGTLVDLGCGQAPYFGIYSPLVEKSIGVDWPSSVHQNSHVDLESDLNTGIDLPDNFADTILCTDVLEHIFKPAVLWSEMNRVAKSGAAVIVGVPFLYWLHEVPHDYHRYTRYALERYAQDAGFKVESLSAIGGFRYVVFDLLSKGARFGTLRHAINLSSRAMDALYPPRPRHSASTAFPLAYVMIVRKP